MNALRLFHAQPERVNFCLRRQGRRGQSAVAFQAAIKHYGHRRTRRSKGAADEGVEPKHLAVARQTQAPRRRDGPPYGRIGARIHPFQVASEEWGTI